MHLASLLLPLEIPRCIFEFCTSAAAYPMLLRTIPKGNGHTVIVVPGLGADNNATVFLRQYLTSLGYNAVPWCYGTNTGSSLSTIVPQLAEQIAQVHSDTGDKVSILGWSLGGIYAREAAKQALSSTCQVMTLGTPFAALSGCINRIMLQNMLLNGQGCYNQCTEQYIATPPPIKTVAFYSRYDAVVPWYACCEPEPCSLHRNVSVYCGSHLGLPYNIQVLYEIAHHLAQRHN